MEVDINLGPKPGERGRKVFMHRLAGHNCENCSWSKPHDNEIVKCMNHKTARICRKPTEVCRYHRSAK